jgi:outer membrane protein assembly factor BamB
VNVPRTAGLVLVGLGVAGIVAGLVLPWARSGGQYPDGAVIAGIALLGPLLGGARLAAGHLGHRAPSIAASAAALVAGVVAADSALDVPPNAGVGLGGPVTIAGAVTAALGWVLVAVGARLAPKLPRPVLIVVATTAVLLALDGVGVYWAVEGRFVDTTTSAAGAPPAAEPRLDAERWHTTGSGGAVLAVSGARILVRDSRGVQAHDARTGRPAWHYLRSDGTVATAGLAGETVLIAYPIGEGVLVVGLDAQTGAERFSRRYRSESWRPKTVVSTEDGRTAVFVGSGPDAGDVVAVDTGTGAARWTWRPERDGGPCDVVGAAPGGPVVGLALRCRAKGVDDVVLGLSTSDGRERWDWHASYTSEVTRGAELAIDASAAGFLVRYGTEPRRAIVLAADSGVTGAGFGPDRSGTGELATVVNEHAVYFQRAAEGADLTAIDTRLGTVAWRVQLPQLITWRLVAARATPARAYLLLTTSQPETASGPLRLVALDHTDGRVVGDHSLWCATACQRATLAVDPRSAVVAAPAQEPATLTLTAHA